MCAMRANWGMHVSNEWFILPISVLVLAHLSPTTEDDVMAEENEEPQVEEEKNPEVEVESSSFSLD